MNVCRLEQFKKKSVRIRTEHDNNVESKQRQDAENIESIAVQQILILIPVQNWLTTKSHRDI